MPKCVPHGSATFSTPRAPSVSKSMAWRWVIAASVAMLLFGMAIGVIMGIIVITSPSDGMGGSSSSTSLGHYASWSSLFNSTQTAASMRDLREACAKLLERSAGQVVMSSSRSLPPSAHYDL